MLAWSIALLLGAAFVCLIVELIFSLRKSIKIQTFWRLGSFAFLMAGSFGMVVLHYWRIDPMTSSNKFQIQGQYFPLDATIRISDDPEVANYYAPTLSPPRGNSSPQSAPLIELSGYNDQDASLHVVVRGVLEPVIFKGEVVNMIRLAQSNEISVGNCRVSLKQGWFGSGLWVDGKFYRISLPAPGEATSVGRLLCEAGVGRDAQCSNSPLSAPNQSAQTADTSAPERLLDGLWLITDDHGYSGLVNGTAESIKMNGNDVSVESTFTLKSGESFSFGKGRSALSLQLKIEPSQNRIYLFPSKPIDMPLYRGPNEANDPTQEVFVTSGLNVAGPSYQLSLGDANRNLIKAALKYSFDPPRAAEKALPESPPEERKELEQSYREGFIVNTGFELKAYKFGETAAIGSKDGGVLATLNLNKTSRWSPILPIAFIWLTPIIMFGALGGIHKKNYVFLLAPLLQLLLAVRLILSYRGYVLPPYLGSSYEKALFASIFVPFAIFVGLYARELGEIFDFSKYPDSHRRVFSSDWFGAVSKAILDLVRLPSFAYMLICLVLLVWSGAVSATWAPIVLTIAFFVVSLVALWLFKRIGSGTASIPLIDWMRSDVVLDIWILFASPLVLAGLLRAFGKGAERLPYVDLRAEIIYLPLLLLASCRFYTWFFQTYLGTGRTIYWYHYLWLFLPVPIYFAQAVVVGDFGFLIYSIPIFFLALIVTWRAGRGVTITALFGSFALTILFLGTPVFSERMPGFLKDSAIEYRFLAYQNPGWLEGVALQAQDEKEQSRWNKFLVAIGWRRPPNACQEGSSAARKILGVHEHFWTMFHFAARGSTGEGYGRSPIEKVPFADGIAQSDNVYSIYVLSEHGSLGGIAVLSVYALFALLLVFIQTQHFAGEVSPNLLLFAIGGTFLFTALYHAAGNTGAVPFTGKNLPLLSLNSTADILLFGFLMSLAFCIIGNDREDLPGTNKGVQAAFLHSANALNRWLAMLAALFLIFFLAVCVKSNSAAKDQLHRGDYDLEEFISRTRDYLKNHVLELNTKTQQIDLKTASAVGLADRQFLRLLRDQFNHASPEEKQNGKYFFMVKDLNVEEDLYGAILPSNDSRTTILTFDQNYFRRRSPFSTMTFWRGGLRSSDFSATDQDSFNGEALTLFPIHKPDLDSPIPGTRDELTVSIPYSSAGRSYAATQFSSRRFNVQDERNERLFDLYAIEGDTVLEPNVARMHVNGQEIRNKTRLESGDIIGIEGTDRRSPLVFIYQRGLSGVLASYRWFNGHEEFNYPQREAFALARPIVEAINAHLGKINQEGNIIDAERVADTPLVLSLDAGLNQAIYNELSKEANGGTTQANKKNPGLWSELSGRRDLPPRISVTALNPDNGEILALASWPSADPNPKPDQEERTDQRSYTNLLRRRDAESRRYFPNHNFTRHVLGSATKPFIAAAAASSFPELGTLSVEDNQSEYENVLGIPTLPSWHGNAAGHVDWDSYLINSNNIYEVIIGFFGVSRPGPNGHIQLTSQHVTQRFNLNGSAYNVQPDFIDIFNTGDGRALNLDQSPLASKLSELFDVKVSGPDEEAVTEVWNNAQPLHLLPAQGGSLNFISPERPNLALNRVRDARGFVGVCLGGNTNRWSNVKSAEAFARLVTGRRVWASMVKVDRTPAFEPLARGYAGVHQQLLRALRGVSERGTAAALAPRIFAIRAARNDSRGPFTVFAKTGTLEGQFRSNRNDSNIILAAGFWNEATQTLSDGVVVSIYVEKGNVKGDAGRATMLASRILEILDRHFHWSTVRASESVQP